MAVRAVDPHENLISAPHPIVLAWLSLKGSGFSPKIKLLHRRVFFALGGARFKPIYCPYKKECQPYFKTAGILFLAAGSWQQKAALTIDA
jgi:hypothetical protein